MEYLTSSGAGDARRTDDTTVVYPVVSDRAHSGWIGVAVADAVQDGLVVIDPQEQSSHTGALLSASDVTVDALFHQAGVIRTDTLHELFDVAALVAKQPIPRGDRIAIR